MSQTLCTDGNVAVATVSLKFIDSAFVYPITPSTTMAEMIEKWAASGEKNLFGVVPHVDTPQSELGAAASMHGALLAGSLCSTYTASQGLLLMIPNIYHMAAEHVPGVLHVSNRGVGTHSSHLSPDHSDVLACRGTGVAMLSSGCVQEAYDMAAIAHLSAIASQHTFIHFFEGFRVSHQFENFDTVDDETLKSMIDFEALYKWRRTDALNNEIPTGRNPGASAYISWQATESQNVYLANAVKCVQRIMTVWGEKTGRKYQPFVYVGHPEAEYVIVQMGCGSQTTEVVVKAMVAKGCKVGLVRVHLYRPFSTELLCEAIPKSAKAVIAMDRIKDPGCGGEPMLGDVLSALTRLGRFGRGVGIPGHVERVVGGRFSVAGAEYTPAHVLACFLMGGWRSGVPAIDEPEMAVPYTTKTGEFVVGILDDVCGLTAPTPKDADALAFLAPPAAIAARIPKTHEALLFGLGSDGTIGACRNAMDIIANIADCHTQAGFEFDGKKSGGLTMSSLRFRLKVPEADLDDEIAPFCGPIRDQFMLLTSDFVACHHESYIAKYPTMLDNVREGSTFFLNATWPWSNDEPKGLAELESHLGARFLKQIAEKRMKLVVTDANRVADEVGLPGRINSITILFFFKYAVSTLVSFEDAVNELKRLIEKTYAKKSHRVVQQNWEAIDAAVQIIDRCEVRYDRDAWLGVQPIKLAPQAISNPTRLKPEIFDKVFIPAMTLQNWGLTTSDAVPVNTGIFPSGLGRFEKPNTAVRFPQWHAQNCLQCNVCSVVCPHQTIRPVLTTAASLTRPDVPAGFDFAELKGPVPKIPEHLPESVSRDELTGGEKLRFRIQVSPMDCKGCGLCVEECVANNIARKAGKGEEAFALTMQPNTQEACTLAARQWDYFTDELPPVGHALFSSTATNPYNIKNAQFTHPFFEFNGSCPGCTETQYLKMITQGPDEAASHMIISVAVGCCLIWAHFNYLRPFYPIAEKDMRARSAWIEEADGGVMRGPVAATSLFEDNAEFGWGMTLGSEQRRDALRARMTEALASGELGSGDENAKLREALGKWLTAFRDHVQSRALQAEIRSLIPTAPPVPGALSPTSAMRVLMENTELLPSRLYWIIGGDGWAYDIGSAGIDHVLHSSTNVNILIMDNNVYSNTGGQCSKGTPLGAFAKHAWTGMRLAHKRLGEMMMNAYPHVFVAQVALGADKMHTFNAIRAAEAHDGPSLIVAYCPCIAHGITAKGGLAAGVGMEEQRYTVETGMWPLYTRDPSKNGGRVQLLTPEPKRDISELVRRELRWSNLAERDLPLANGLVDQLREDIYVHMNNLRFMAGMSALEAPKGCPPAFQPVADL